MPLDNIVESLKNGLPIVGGPGMHRFVHSEFLSRSRLMDQSRTTIFALEFEGKRIKFQTNVAGLFLTGPEGTGDGRAFIFFARGHWELPISESTDSYTPNTWYRGHYNPIDRSGTVRSLTKEESAVIERLM